MAKEFKPHGCLSISNWGGIEIEINGTNMTAEVNNTFSRLEQL